MGMMRWRFSSGLLLGLVMGATLGTVIGALLRSPHGDAGSGAMALQVQELSRKLAEAQEARMRADQQLERFAQLAEQMATSFNKLDERFKTLAELAQALEAQTAATPASAPEPAAAGTPTAVTDPSS